MCATSKFVVGETITQFLDDLTSKFTQSMTKGAKGPRRVRVDKTDKSPRAGVARSKSAWT